MPTGANGDETDSEDPLKIGVWHTLIYDGLIAAGHAVDNITDAIRDAALKVNRSKVCLPAPRPVSL